MLQLIFLKASKISTRDADVRRIKPLIASLKNGTAGNGTEKKAPAPIAQKQAVVAPAGD